MKLKRLTEAGIEEFRKRLALSRAGHEADFIALRDDPRATELVEPSIDIDDKMPTGSRLEVGKYLADRLAPLTGTRGSLLQDKGIWSWMTLAWIDQLAPASPDGHRNVQNDYRWIPSGSFRTYYRHMLTIPYELCSKGDADIEESMVLLAGPVDRIGDMNEQLASRQAIVSNPTVLGAATKLYFDPTKRAIKRSATNKGAGSVHRFVTVIEQFALTWDLADRSSAEIVELLPGEFDKYRALSTKHRIKRNR